MPRRYRFRVNPDIVRFLLIIVFLYLGVQVFLIVQTRFRPTLFAVAEARARVIATEAINEAVTTKISQEVNYQNLVSIHKDHQGQVAWAAINTMEVNRLEAELTIRVQNTLKAIKSEVVRIPLGQALGSELLASLGPSIPVTFIPVGTVTMNVDDLVEDVGINVVRHKIYLDVWTDVQIVIPFLSDTVRVNTKVPIVDNIYPGQVPYFYWAGDGKQGAGTSRILP